MAALASIQKPQEVHHATPGARLASADLSIILICSRQASLNELAPMIRAALPTESLHACVNAGDAISRVSAERIFGRPTGVFIFDFRGEPVGDLVSQVMTIHRAHPQAELLVVAEGRESPAFAACVQVIGSADKLTFVVAPLDGRAVQSTVRTITARYRALANAARMVQDAGETISDLELQVHELRTRLDIARHAARHDDLTGLLNRAGFIEELTSRLSRNLQNQNVLMIDLDRFKAVNDTLGHGAGDELVRKICVALASAIPAGGVLARLGGDEFGVITEASTDRGVATLCKKILHVCSESRLVLGHEVQVSASIGVAQQGATQSEIELMRQADLALYAAKREGRNRFRLFDTELDKVTRYRMSIESGMERGLRSGQFRMVYQPIVKAESGAIQGFEALVRWESPEYGLVSPSEFIPIAEETGLILELGDWITRQALKDCRRWGGPYVSINLSVRQFLRHNVAERILRYAADADVAPERFRIELTETAIIDDVERADHHLKILRAAGVQVALDDFGTGYSSLVYLNQFAIDCIKIDKSFVDNVTRDRQSAVIVASVAKLAGSLGMSVVAEGVETEEQRKVLIAAGCGHLQGFLFGKPVTGGEVPGLLGPAGASAQP